MEVIAQKLDDIVDSLRTLTVEWQDDTARRVIDRLKALPVKKAYRAPARLRRVSRGFTRAVRVRAVSYTDSAR